MNRLKSLAARIRYDILTSTTAAGSGHPTSSLSAVELMATLMFGGFFRYRLDDPAYVDNDRLVFSKGHAAPLFYALFSAAGVVDQKELLTLRQFGSRLEGHPTLNFPYTEAPTGSLGQGIGIAVGEAINAKYLDKLSYRTFVLLGDSEMAEGSVWESMALATHYKLDNLVALLDVNRLGQRGETMLGWDTKTYAKRAEAFGWKTIIVDGHNTWQISRALAKAAKTKNRPTIIIAKTIKGKGISFLENKNGWHGKALTKEQLKNALAELPNFAHTPLGTILQPPAVRQNFIPAIFGLAELQRLVVEPIIKNTIAPRHMYGATLARLAKIRPEIVALDAETGNSTGVEEFALAEPKKFFEMFIAEQNMVSVAQGLATRGKIPFISTFAAFLSRAQDQIRMADLAGANIKLIGSHCGVSIGADGASQMAIQDIAQFRGLQNATVLYPADGMSMQHAIALAAETPGLVYVRSTRNELPVIYGMGDNFRVGGSLTLHTSDSDVITVCAAGITVHEALAAYKRLQDEGIMIRVIDMYSIKPIDAEAIQQAIAETRGIVTVEDHVPEGGLADAIRAVLPDHARAIYSLAVRNVPKSGTTEELLAYEKIDQEAIYQAVKEMLE